jgi:hypothetical protein
MESGDAQKQGTPAPMSRFVVLLHDHPVVHWDLMLERETTLQTWRLLSCPEAGQDIRAEPLTDHRLHYLDYEGPVSGNRGTVTRWDFGTYCVLERTASVLRCRLEGTRLRGTVSLQSQGRGHPSVFCYSPDSEASG